MNEIKCPQCGTVFQVDEQGYADIARQVRDQEFSRQLAERERIMERERAAAVELAEQKAERQLQETVSGRDARIAELEGEIAEAAKTAENAEKLRAEMDELRRRGDEERVGFELQLAGARNVKAVRALLPDYDNDIDKLKAAEPWLFGSGAAASAQAGATGLPNADAATDEGATMRRWRKIASIEDEE